MQTRVLEPTIRSNALGSADVAVVMGISHAAGCLVAEHLAAQGVRLVLADADPELADDMAAELRRSGADVVATADSTLEMGGPAAAITQALGRYGSAGILVNALPCGRIEPGEMADLLQMGVESVMGVLPVMVANGYGRIVNVGGSIDLVYRPLTSASDPKERSCLHRMTFPLVRDFASRGITLNSVSCMFRQKINPPFALHRSSLLARYGNPPDKQLRGFDTVGAMAAWLASPAAHFLNGQILCAELDAPLRAQ